MSLLLAFRPSASGIVDVTGTIAVVQADQATAFTVTQTIAGTIDVTQANQTTSFDSYAVGTIGPTQENDIASFTGFVLDPNPGTASITQDDDVASFTGIVANPVTGTISIIQADQQTRIHANRFGRQPVETREAGPVFPAGRRRRYYNASRNPVTGPG